MKVAKTMRNERRFTLINVRRWRFRLTVATLLLLFVLSVRPAVAQATPVRAEVDRDTISTDETVTLSITILGTDASRPSLPVLDGFQIAGSSTSSRLSIVNGVTSSEAIYSYVLRPTRAGELVIPAITVSVGGQSYNTEPITVEVTQGATPSQPSSPGGPLSAPGQLDGSAYFVEAEVDNPTPYLGQQITYTFRFYQAETLLGQPGYDPPEFAGFWSRQDPEQVQYFVDQDKTTYRVTELRTLLFPSVVGERVISPGTFQLPGTFLRSGATLRSNPVTVTVRPTPSPAPSGFDGAVGQLSITAEIRPDVAAVNEPVTLRVTVEGQGNIETLPDPALPELDGWRAFERTSSVNTQMRDGYVTGSRVYEQLLVPATAGEFVMPAIDYTYFDPEMEAYQTVTTEPINITVSGGAVEAPIPAVPGVTQETVTQIDNDIRHIKPVLSKLESAPSSLTSSPAYWLLWLLPISIAAADWGWRRRQAYRANNPDLVRRSQALKKAKQALAQARRQQLDPHVAVGHVLSAYLSDKLSQPIAGLTQRALADRLHRCGADDPLVARVCEVLALSDTGRFAPIGANGVAPSDLIWETERLIVELDTVL